MNDDAAPRAVYLLIIIVMIASSLAARRLPLRETAKMALAWVAIFGVVFALFVFRDDFSTLGARLRAEVTGAPVECAGTLRIPRSEDGHYWVEASVNGERGRFLVDSGATITTISPQLARSAGIARSGPGSMVETANGAAMVDQATADRFALGSIERTDFPVNVSRSDGVNVVGMNFLTRLSGWGVEGTTLVLRP
ncbi:TIGR02281 family clan AA aspartic protease [Sphingomonas ginkgonis]|uniref:TIGR02281 family clan AA aspartic protease n=1 Tax=Sphingomonas ginkgonis TaxID=2315330 RepID=A0A3S0EMQ8_9SPHN|nr:TIGR02281 family clan AA aspartic protease [Sphingomonas ginkgonis]RST31100.1 TIGR02281 family clan AA aspartic protease [Sphingomonas ginkgonis]